MTTRHNILGIPIDAISIPEAVDRIIIESRRPGSRYIVKPYVEFSDYSARHILHEAWLSLPDGVAWQWAAYYQQTNCTTWQLFKTLSQIVLRPSKLRSVVPEKFAGINFTRPLLEQAAVHGRSVFLVGSPKYGTIEGTAAAIRRTFPGLHISGTVAGRDGSGEFSARLEANLLHELQQKTPDIILIGLGHPLQEEIMYRLTRQLNHGIMIGEGGSFDYRELGGRIKRAPRSLQKLGLEWLWRLLREPRRIRRQTAIPRFIVRIYRNLHEPPDTV